MEVGEKRKSVGKRGKGHEIRFGTKRVEIESGRENDVCVFAFVGNGNRCSAAFQFFDSFLLRFWPAGEGRGNWSFKSKRIGGRNIDCLFGILL